MIAFFGRTVFGNMILPKDHIAPEIDTRDGLIPVVSAATGTLLAITLYGAFPALATITGSLSGAAAGILMLKRHGLAMRPAPANSDANNDARIGALEAELQAERRAAVAFRQEMAEREIMNQRFLSDLEMTRAVLEGQASQTIELAEQLAQQKLRSDYLANHDLLTGLPNRRVFQEELKQRVDRAADNRATTALMFVDLDCFKDVNDTLGHEAGDRLLQQVAQTFGLAIRDDDFVARLGGDEFAVIVDIPPHEAREIASMVAERVRQALQLKVPAPGTDLSISATIGIALYPHDADTVEGVLHAADQVMYVGKRRGRNRVITTDELRPTEG